MLSKLVGNLELVGEKLSPGLTLYAKLMRGTATAKEREDYMIYHASEAERIIGKPSCDLDYEEWKRYAVLSENLKEGNLEGGDCKICRNKGYIVGYTNGYEWQKECSCMAQRRAKECLKLSEYEEYITSKTFDNFNCEDDQHRYALSQARKFLKQNKYPFLYIGGTTGTGKSHLTVAVYYKLVQQGYVGEFVKWENEYSSLNAERFSDPVAFKKRMNKLKYSEVLLIDDILWNEEQKQPSPAEWKVAKEILDERSIRGLKTLMSSNYNLKELFNLNQVVGGRISEFTGGLNNFAIELNGKNYRMLKEGQMLLVEEDIGF